MRDKVRNCAVRLHSGNQQATAASCGELRQAASGPWAVRARHDEQIRYTDKAPTPGNEPWNVKVCHL